MKRPLVLIISYGNAARGQMAEGILRAHAGDLFLVQSAGTIPAAMLDLRAAQVMDEIGIGINHQAPKGVFRFKNRPVEFVFTVCPVAARTCPTFPGQVSRRDYSFNDSIGLRGAEPAPLDAYRSVRDDIRRVFEAYADGLRDGFRVRS